MKGMLKQYRAALARVKILRQQIETLDEQIEERYVSDVVTCGKKGKKPLRTVRVSGLPYKKADEIAELLQNRRDNLHREEMELLDCITKVEEYISRIRDIEMRNIMTFYCVDNLTWMQVAHKMNEITEKKEYTEDSCRSKFERFLKKNNFF